MITNGESSTPWELQKWELIERFGWTIEYCDNLSMGDLHELIQVDDGRNKARNSAFNKR